MERVKRIEKTGMDDFVRNYISANRPVIVTDAMHAWPALKRWTPKYFSENFGDLNTQIYNNLFTLQDVVPLRDYIDRSFGRDDQEINEAYARWYVKFKELDFDWSDAVFDAIADDWSHPYFIPTSSYVMPFCAQPDSILANRDTFPYKGLFLSSRGARTRLHRDPFGTDALLCQFYGTKRLAIYHPNDRDKLQRGQEFVDPRNPDIHLFPEFSTIKPLHQDELEPGEILFIPSGWFHDVLSLTDSISVTWNFVHAANREPFLREINDPVNDFDRDMLEFFFASERIRDPSIAEITRMARSVQQ